MRTVIRRWGNGAAVRIPAAIMRAAQLHIGQEVNVRVMNDSIVLQPVRAVSYDLTSLLEGVTEDNLHGEMPFGSAVGRETE